MVSSPEPNVHDEVAEVTARVCDRIPDIDGGAIETQVSQLFDAYADSKVRVFLPILVEREAVARLTHHRHDVAG